ncbi:MAG: 5-(carboxyamino)imidazole ribonucleotide synthase [Pseudomonadota bacterium]
MDPIQPGAMLGMLGGGQLGRMFTQAAQRMGYRVTVLDPDVLSPTGQIAERHLQTAYTDSESLDVIAQTCAAVSIEFESVPAAALRALEGRVRLAPSVAAVEIAQNRILEKQFVRDAGLDTADFASIESLDDAASAFTQIGVDCIIKTATLGYDGKGQAICSSEGDVIAAFKQFGEVPCVLEQKIDLRTEVSVVLARSDAGEAACFPVSENTHVNGILDTSVVPAQIDDALASKAQSMAMSLAHTLEYVGVIGVEMFVTTDDRVLINEIAPRPHNSGHYTLDATVSSQFEQQVRMMCGLPASDTALTSPVVMLNLLGDVWHGAEPDWSAVVPSSAYLHLYGKAEPRPGRKMGHINVLGSNNLEALEVVHGIRQALAE